MFQCSCQKRRVSHNFLPPSSVHLTHQKGVLETTLCMIWFKINHRSQIPETCILHDHGCEKNEALFKFKFLKIPLYYLGRKSSISVFLSLFELFAPFVNFPTVNFFGLHMFTKEVRLRISPSAGNKMLGKLVGWRPSFLLKKKIHLNLP